MNEKETVQGEQEPRKRRGGRKPMTEDQKAERARVRAEEKKKADNLTPEVVIQYQDSEANVAALIEAAKANFRSAKKRTRITDMKLYIKPEERMAYYVVNESFDGKIAF